MNDRQIPASAEKQSSASAADTGSRKGPRLPLEFTIAVRYQASNGEMIRSNCKTISVSVNGALVALNGAVQVGQFVQLTNVKTGQEVQCVVRSVRQEDKDQANRVGVEFSVWTPGFWEITFPRQAHDPLATAPATLVREARPLFGHVGPMPLQTPQQTPAGPRPGDSPDYRPAPEKAAGSGIWQNKKAILALAVALAIAALLALAALTQ